MRPRSLRTLLLALIFMATGCVERRLIVETTPPGARVFVNDVDYGISPAYVPFTYYGTYNFRIMADGYQTQTFQKRIKAPWYAYPPFDFFVETFWPFQISDIRPVAFDLMPAPPPDLARLKAEGAELRAQGKNLPPPRETPSSKNKRDSNKTDESKKSEKPDKTEKSEKPENKNNPKSEMLPESEIPKVVPPPPPPSPRVPQEKSQSFKENPYQLD
ncbi:MAG: PEGA domain-containing protein [Gemmataceae bacterium]|nr:PEGA domain-containing protein [Gemmataceae bacterium]